MLIFSPQNLRRLNTLSIADMGPIPKDLLQSFDQLKALNLSGNQLVNTSLTLLDSISSLEVSDIFNYSIVQSLTVSRNGNGFHKRPRLHKTCLLAQEYYFILENKKKMKGKNYGNCNLFVVSKVTNKIK